MLTIPPRIRASQILEFNPYKTVFSREISIQRKKDLWKGIQQILPVSIYKTPTELIEAIQPHIALINQNSKTVAGIGLILRQATLQGFLEHGDYFRLKSQIKAKKSHPDIYVPTDEEIRKTLAALEAHHRIAYQLLLYSGIRVSELQYLFDNLKKLKIQEMNGFAKITLDWSRGSKNSFFIYMPTDLLSRMCNAQNKLSGLQSRIKELDLIPLKYARKYFATKCIEAGIKSEVIDFYEGRSQRTILFNHYVNLQSFADQDYTKVMGRLNEALAAPAKLMVISEPISSKVQIPTPAL